MFIAQTRVVVQAGEAKVRQRLASRDEGSGIAVGGGPARRFQVSCRKTPVTVQALPEMVIPAVP